MSTDVRDWAREQGMEVSDRGRLPKAVQQRYDAEHEQLGEPEVAGLGHDQAGDDYDGGVTEADFPPAAGGDLGPLEGHDTGTAAAAVPGRRHLAPVGDTGEQAPRAVHTAKVRRSFRERVWGGGGTKPAKPAKPARARMSLRTLAEDMFLDAAWAFQSLPPVEKVLYLEAPLAGDIFDKSIKGTAADKVFQPIARANQQIKGIEALTAPLWVGLIVARGRKDEQGNYSPETRMMFGGLRHALLSLTRSTTMDFDKLRKKSEELRTASGQVDRMIEWLFEVPEQPQEAEARQEQEGQAAGVHLAPVPAGKP